MGILYNPELEIVSENSSRSINDSDHGQIIEVTGTVTLTIPQDLRANFTCTVVNIGAGVVTIASGVGVTKNSASGLFDIENQYEAATFYQSTTGANDYVVIGDV